MLTELLQRISYLFRRRRFDDDLDAELQFHLDARADELVAGGMTRPAALVQARREFGSSARMQEETRSAWQFGWVEDLASDLRYAARGFKRNPAFAATAIACLALGIGANTTMFSVAAEALFSKPSVREPQTIRSLRVGGISHLPMADYRFLRDAQVFDGLAGEHEDQHANWRIGDATYRLFAIRVSDNYFDVTGTPLTMGRGIATGEHDTAVVSWRFWNERLGGDPMVLGRKLILDGRPHTITGVLTRKHRTMFGAGISPDLYLPANDTIRMSLFARIRPGVSDAEIRSRLIAAAQELDRISPARDKRAGRIRIGEVEGLGRLRSQPEFLPIAAFFGMLMIVVSLVLVIASANVASLLLARASSRSQEMAVRLSIGAGRGRLVRQLLAETLLLGLCGAAAGLLINLFATSWLSNIHLPLPIPIRLDVQPDWRLLGYATLVAIGSSLVAGLAPAINSARAGLSATLKRGERQTAGGWNLRNGLVAGQIAVSIVLLSAGFLFLRNVSEASGMNPGFDVDHTVWASMRLVPEQYDSRDRVAALIDTALARLRGTPGVDAAAIVRVVPLNDEMDAATTIRVDGGNAVRAEWYQNDVSPDYFRTMQIPLVAGRDFRPNERGIVIVNENFARTLFGDTNPLGHTIDSDPLGKVEVIGVARNSSYFTLADRNALAVYRPYRPEAAGGQAAVLHFLARAAGRPEPITGAIRHTLDRLDPTSAIEVRPMNQALTMALLPSRAGALVLGSAGALGLSLAAVGLYGVLLYTVSRRIREIGLRVALGATPAAILRLVLRHSMGLVGAGTAVGLAIAAVAVRPLAAYLVPGVSPGDPLNFAVVAGVLFLVALAATAAPALRALRIDPLTALRHD
jgi:predicted permease